MGQLRGVRGEWVRLGLWLAGWAGELAEHTYRRTANLSGGNLTRLFPRARTGLSAHPDAPIKCIKSTLLQN
jgi:hypothetical protein